MQYFVSSFYFQALPELLFTIRMFKQAVYGIPSNSLCLPWYTIHLLRGLPEWLFTIAVVKQEAYGIPSSMKGAHLVYESKPHIKVPKCSPSHIYLFILFFFFGGHRGFITEWAWQLLRPCTHKGRGIASVHVNVTWINFSKSAQHMESDFQFSMSVKVLGGENHTSVKRRAYL